MAKPDRSHRQKLLNICRPFKVPLISASILTGVITLVGLLPPLLMRHLINDVARDRQWGLFELIIGLMISIPVFKAIISVTNSLIIRKAHLGIIASVRKQLFAHCLHLPMDYYNDNRVGQLVSRLMGDVISVSSLITEKLILVLNDGTAIIFALIVMFHLNVPLALLAVGILPLYYLNYRFFTGHLKNNTEQFRFYRDQVSNSLQERLAAHELIQTFALEELQQQQFAAMATQVRDASLKGAAYDISYDQLTRFLRKIGNSCIYCAGCYFFLKGEMGYGDVIAFGSYASHLMAPIVRLSKIAGVYTRAGVSIDRISDVLAHSTDEFASLDGGKQLAEITQGIAFENISVSVMGKPALENVSMNIPAASCVALVAPPGPELSATALLLQRLISPSCGQLKFDDADVLDLDIKEYRHRVALVLPESTIFDGTILENLCYGDTDASEVWVKKVCRTVGLEKFINNLRDGYQTRLGTGGIRLAAGARQQIGIARAIISKPLVLVSNDATGAMDAEAAEKALKAMTTLIPQCTVILMITRLMMGRHADKVFFLENKKVVEEGHHDELLAMNDGRYRRMFIEQYGVESLPEGGQP